MKRSDGLMILGDWGTTVNRLYLAEWRIGQLNILATVEGQGTKNNADPEASFFELSQAWLQKHGAMPVYLIGTVGLNIGWEQVDYVACPTDQSKSLDKALRFNVRGIDFVIFPGLSCINRHGLHDSMRDEETQIFGFLMNQAKSFQAHPAQHLVCLPSTYMKSVLVENGIVTTFLTSPIGELYEVFCLYSALLKSATVKGWDDSGFIQCLTLSVKRTSSLLHTLFATCSQQVIDGCTNAQAAGFLSGLLIGSEIKSAQRSLDEFSHVVLIGTSHVNSLYQKAFHYYEMTTEIHGSVWATTEGINTIASSEWNNYD